MENNGTPAANSRIVGVRANGDWYEFDLGQDERGWYFCINGTKIRTLDATKSEAHSLAIWTAVALNFAYRRTYGKSSSQ